MVLPLSSESEPRELPSSWSRESTVPYMETESSWRESVSPPIDRESGGAPSPGLTLWPCREGDRGAGTGTGLRPAAGERSEG
ncbi:hypothetical protein chiPu_0028141, partial [Chiloscyllium punctatum]|nr:hypothetical protein [Chiloscyllium punctatum]